MTTLRTPRTTRAPGPASAPDPADLVRRIRRGRARWAMRRTLVLLVLVLAAFVVRVTLGDFTITVPDVVRIIGGAEVPGASFILMESKLPRAVGALLAGAALAVAGAIMQDLMRNPLASPDILGVSGGASTAAVFSLVVLGLDGTGVTVAAFLGASAVAAFLIGMSGGAGRGNTQALVIVGVGCAALLVALTHWVLLRADVYRLSDAMVWLTGSVSSVTWPELGRLALLVAVLIPAMLLLHRQLRVVLLGDDLAAGLGVATGRHRALAMLGVVLLVAGTCAVCGPIAFVALLSGPIGRRVHRGRTRLVDIALIGALMVIVADYVAAYLVPGGSNLPVGVVTGLAGAPFLIWLIVTRTRVETA